MFSTQQYSGFDPRTIPGCQLWLDAADSNAFTFSSGSNVATWKDKSQNLLTGTAINSPTRVANSMNGLPAVVFTGTQYIDYGNNLNLGTNSVYVFTVVKYDSTADGAIVGKSLLGAQAGRWSLYRISGDGGTGMLIDRSGSGVFSAFSGTSTTPQLLCGYWDRPNVVIRQDGIQKTSVSAPSTASLSTTNNLFVGVYQNSSGTGPAAGYYLVGKISEIIVYIGSSLTAFQLQTVEGYLAWKWGLNTNLPSTHLFKSNPVVTRIFQPTDVSGCFLWLDGADAKTVGVSGTNVTAWNDKSGTGNNLSTISATPPTYSSTTGAITFTAANQTAIRGSLNTTYTNPITTFVVCSITSPGVDGARNLLNFGTNGSSATFIAGQYNLIITPPAGSPAFITYANNGVNPTGQGTNIQTYIPTTYNTIGIFENLSTYSGTNLTNDTYLNGNTSTYSSVNTTWTVASPYVTSAGYVSIGNDTAGTAGTGGSFNGNIYEVIAFSKTLSTSERQQIEGYLTAKWGLSSLLPTTQPYYLLRALPGTPYLIVIPGFDTITLTKATANTLGAAYVAKYNQNGRLLWAGKLEGSTTGGTNGNVLPNNGTGTMDASGNVYVSGQYNVNQLDVYNASGTVAFSLPSASSNRNQYLVKYNTLGVAQWGIYCENNSTSTTIFNSGLKVDASGNVYMFMMSAGAGASYNLYNSDGTLYTSIGFLGATGCLLVQISPTGFFNWYAIIDGPGSDSAYRLELNTTGPCIVGHFNSTTLTFFNSNGTPFTTLTTTAGNLESFFAQYDTSGFGVWAAKGGGTAAENGYGIATDTTDNSVYFTGYTISRPVTFTAWNSATTLTWNGTGAGQDAYIVKYNSDGVPQWACGVSSSANDLGWTMCVDGNNNLYVSVVTSGTSITIFDSAGGTTTLTRTNTTTCNLIIQYSSSGSYLGVFRIDGTGVASTFPTIAVDSANNLYLATFSSSNPIEIYDKSGSLTTSISYTGTNLAFLTKFNSSGIYLWHARQTSAGGQNETGVGTSSSGDIAITGRYAETTFTVCSTGF